MFDKAMIYQNLDDAYMAQCLQLAEMGAGFVSPNPMVGSIVLDVEGRVVGRGYHPKVGDGHAEVFALNEAGEKAKGGTLYVNLEPCNHQGRTPPCTQKIIDAGIARVVCGTLDPNSLVSGAGRDRLQNERISVRTGFLQTECEKLNESFFYHIRHQMPFVTVKLALSMDGKIANRHKESKWLTNSYSRQIVHQMRQAAQAVVTTAETVLADDPNLTVRDIAFVRRQPDKVIFDRTARLDPGNYKIFRGDTSITWIVSDKSLAKAEAAIKAAKRTLPEIETTVTLLAVPEKGNHLDLQLAFKKLYQKGLANLFVESGGQFASALLDQQLVQKLYLFYAPKLIRDNMGQPAFSQLFELNFPQNAQFKIVHTETIENDWLIEAKPIKAKVVSDSKAKKLSEPALESIMPPAKNALEEKLANKTDKDTKVAEPAPKDSPELSLNGTSSPRPKKKVAESSSEGSVELSPNGTSEPRPRKKLVEENLEASAELSVNGTSMPRPKKKPVEESQSSEELVELSSNGTSMPRPKKQVLIENPEEPEKVFSQGSVPLPPKGFKSKLRRTR